MVTDVAAIQETLDRIVDRVGEARAAVEVIADGDTTALRELDAVTDELADDVADLKRQTAAPQL